MLSIEGKLINFNNETNGRVEIDTKTGLISFVGKAIGHANIMAGPGQFIFPGFIDLHVHARECADHSQDYKEDFNTAGEAAINGGVVAFADMPNNPISPVDEKSYEEKHLLAKKSAVDVVLYAGIGENTKPLQKSVPYKIYMGKSVGDLFFESFVELERALKKYRAQNISFHCEDPFLLLRNQNALTHEARRSVEAEVSAVDFALKMIEKYNLTGKICHCSTKEALKKIIEAKKRGVKVTVEVTPHHLYFNEEMLRSAPIYRHQSAYEWARYMQTNPPIRSKEDRLALIGALKNGDIDYLATDHAPHSLEEKKQGISGLTHLDTFGPFTAWLMKEHKFLPKDIARVCSYNPAQFFNQFVTVKYGEIAKGFEGSLSILDINNPITVEKSFLKTKARWSPFEGVEFPGRVAMTIIRGKVYKM